MTDYAFDRKSASRTRVSPASRSFVARAGRHLSGLLRSRDRQVSEATSQLLALAATYERTQPSYAADLRQAAQGAD